MIKFLGLFFLFLFLSNCSLDKATGIWSKSKKIEIEEEKPELVKLFREKNLDKEFNSSLLLTLNSEIKNKNFNHNLDNNYGVIDYNGNLQSISKYKFSKIDNFNEVEPEIIFHKNSLIFFDNIGTILKFDSSSKLIWKKNHYSKSEKKLKPKLFFAKNKDILVITDNIAKYYAVNIKNGRLLWMKSNTASFNSQVKIYKDQVFVVDHDNILRSYSIKDGSELWKIKTETSLIKSQKKLSIIIVEDKVFFNSSIGDISAVDIATGNLIWQTPTQSSAIYENAFFLKTSDLIADKNSILFSNNQNEFFSLNVNSGSINWKQKINSDLRPSLIGDIVVSITISGYLNIINKNTGDIIRITDIFDQFKPKKRKKIIPIGFIVGKQNIYLTTNTGKLLVINTKSGKTKSILKIDNERISRPFILNQNLFIVKKNSIIKLD